ncbi:MAG TPA: hypothetical protein VF763_12660 [Candidatus Limnocylindrales bacterium]
MSEALRQPRESSPNTVALPGEPGASGRGGVVPAQPAAPSREPARRQGRHPSLGLPPIDMTAGHPAAAQRLQDRRVALGTRALEIALDLDPTFDERYDDLAFRHFLRDTGILIDRLARSVASGDPRWAAQWAEWVAPVYRRRSVPMDDLVTLTEGIRRAAAPWLDTAERESLDAACEAAIVVFRQWRRLAGDARERNPLVAFFYRGA